MKTGSSMSCIQSLVNTTIPCSGINMDHDIYPTTPSQPSSLPQPYVIFIKYYNESGIIIMHATCNRITEHEQSLYH